jgi:hypothetical protein
MAGEPFGPTLKLIDGVGAFAVAARIRSKMCENICVVKTLTATMLRRESTPPPRANRCYWFGADASSRL